MATIDGIHNYIDKESNLEHLTKDFLYVTRVFNERLMLGTNTFTCFVIPKGFKTDGASIPRLVRPLAGLSPRDQAIRFPALGHDFLYAKQEVTLYHFDKVTKKKGAKIGTFKLSRKECDVFIYEEMKYTFSTIRQRLCTYLGLRIGGWYMFGKAKKLLNKKES